MERERQHESEAQRVANIDERTDRTRRSVAASVGNGLLLLALMAMPRLAGSSVFGDLDAREGVALALPGFFCVVVGAILYRRVGPKHRLYRGLEALELCALHGIPAFFPLLDGSTPTMAGGFLLVSAVFWGQVKPGRARLYGSLIGALAVVPAVLLWARGEAEAARLSGIFGVASVLAYAMSVRFRLETVRAELRRDRLREKARALRIARERHRIERELTDHVGARLEALATQLAQAGLPEAAAAGRLGKMVSELVFPDVQPVAVSDLSELTRSRCRALCPGVRLLHRTSLPASQLAEVSATAARAVLRIAQELVRNSVVHGGARTIEVALEAASEELRLTVSDDGVGLSAAVAEGASGGLLNAKNWAAESGGSLRLGHRPGFNTSLTVNLSTAPPRVVRPETPACALRVDRSGAFR